MQMSILGDSAFDLHKNTGWGIDIILAGSRRIDTLPFKGLYHKDWVISPGNLW